MDAKKPSTRIFIVGFLFLILILALNSTPTLAATKFTITVTQGNNGQISPGTTQVDQGHDQTFTINPSNGYFTASLIVDGSPVTVASTYTFSNVQASHTITATFTIQTYTITVTQSSNGVISPGTTTANYGDSPSFNITPNTGYSIASLIVDGSSVAVASSYAFNNVKVNHTITATYTVSTFTITVNQGSNGVVSPGTTNVNYGNSQTFTITPNSGYSVASLIVDGSSIAAASTYTFNNVTAVHTISATFSNTFQIMVVQGANGQISPGTSTVNYGTNNVFSVTASVGYSINNVVVDGVSMGALTSYTFSNVQADHNITASFVINQYSVAITVGAFGSSNLASQTVNWGTSMNFVLTPDAGYSVSDVKINGTSIGITNSFSINITGSTAVDVSFAVNTFGITINSGLHGSVSSGNQTVNYGIHLTLTINPEVGYHVVDVRVNDTSIGALTSYSFSATGPTSITATFAINTFMITVVQGSNGVISPGTTNVNYGDSSSFTVTPNAGYSIASLIVDGSSVAAASSSYTFSNVVAGHTISATFSITTTPTTTPTPEPASSPTPAPAQATAPTPTPISTKTPTTPTIPTPTPIHTTTPTTTPTPTPTPTPTTDSTALLYFAIPLIASIACITGVIVVKKRNGSSKKMANTKSNPPPSDFPLLSLTKGAQLPDSYSLMIAGEARAEKGLFCEQLAIYYLKQGKPIIYVTYNRFPGEIRNDMKVHGWDIAHWEQDGNFVFVDAYSSIASKQSQEKCYVKQPFSLSELGISISNALNDFQEKSVIVFLDSTGPLFTRLDCSKVAEFLQDRCAQIKGRNSMFFFTFTAGTIPDNMQNRLEDMADGLIELKTYSEKGITERKITIKKLRGNNYSNVELTMNFPDALVAAEKK